MSAVASLLRAELLKLRTLPAARALAGAMALVTLVAVALTLATHDADELAGAGGVRTVLTVGGSASCLFALVLGILGMTGEHRDETIGYAVLAAPARWPVVIAKLVAYALGGLLLGVIALAITFAVGVPALADKGADVSYGSTLVRTVVLGTLAAAALFAAIGVGLGALVRDPKLALAAGLGWVLLVDSLVLQVAPAAGKFLPRGAVTSLLRSETHDVLPAAIAALVLLAYALALAGAGTVAFCRRDLT